MRALKSFSLKSIGKLEYKRRSKLSKAPLNKCDPLFSLNWTVSTSNRGLFHRDRSFIITKLKERNRTQSRDTNRYKKKVELKEWTIGAPR